VAVNQLKICIFLWKWECQSSSRDRLLVHKDIISAVKRVEFISDGMSYITLRGCYGISVLNVDALTEI